MYLWIKAFHIVAVIVWIGGMLGGAVQLTALRSAAPSSLDAVRRWDTRVTTPAMLLVWILGLALAITGGWFPSRWLFAKLALVLLLSGVHGVLAGSLRRLALRPDATVPGLARYAPAAIVTAVTLIVVLVVIKPF
jgi:putative membrane protein